MRRPSLLWSLYERQDGSSLAAVLMVTLVVTVIGISSIQVAQHSNDVTAVDRERVQAVQAAEAGVNNAIRRLGLGAGCDASPTAAQTLSDQTGVVGSYRERIDPEGGTTCGETLTRLVHAWGFAPTGGTRAMRHLEVTVKLVPQSGFPYTLFAEGTTGTIFVKNSGAITGSAYAETLDQSKNNIDAEDIVTTGSLEAKNNASYSGTIWAGGDITLGDNSSVGKSVLTSGTAPSTDGDVILGQNNVVGTDVLAKGTVTSGSGTVIHGVTLDNNPNVPPPPVIQKPAFVWNAANYLPTVAVEKLASGPVSITADLNAQKNDLKGVFHSIDAGGTITLPNNATVTGPLTIVSAGKVVLGKSLSVSGGPYQVVIIALDTSATSIDVASTFTAASGLDVLLYSLGTVDMKNAMTFKGAIYANTIDAKNTLSVQQSDSLATNAPVGFTFDVSSTATFVPVPTLWREVVPGPPPA